MASIRNILALRLPAQEMVAMKLCRAPSAVATAAIHNGPLYTGTLSMPGPFDQHGRWLFTKTSSTAGFDNLDTRQMQAKQESERSQRDQVRRSDQDMKNFQVGAPEQEAMHRQQNVNATSYEDRNIMREQRENKQKAWEVGIPEGDAIKRQQNVDMMSKSKDGQAYQQKAKDQSNQSESESWMKGKQQKAKADGPFGVPDRLKTYDPPQDYISS